MARYAIVVGGVVVNVIEASPEFVASLGGTAIASAAAGPGDSWNGTAFTAQTPALVVPQSVSMAQARIAMARASISEAAVAAAIAIGHVAVVALLASLKARVAADGRRHERVGRYDGARVAALGNEGIDVEHDRACIAATIGTAHGVRRRTANNGGRGKRQETSKVGLHRGVNVRVLHARSKSSDGVSPVSMSPPHGALAYDDT